MAIAPRAAYVHVPFCRHRCGYCNFTVSVATPYLAESYLQAVTRELQSIAGPHAVDSLFFGGGTPTQLAPLQLASLFRLVYRCFPPQPNAEISVEANPENIDDDCCQVLRDWGVNRISLGVQSFASAKLQRLERSHQASTIIAAVHRLRAFCHNISLDLIFAAPGETLADWSLDLQSAAECQPQHVSTYGLTYERGTTFWGRKQRGELSELDESCQRQFYETSIDFWEAWGFDHYEVSNFAKPGYQCRHNQVYWHGEEYFAVGPGAARYVDGWRETNHRSTSTYIKRVLSGQSPTQEREQLGPGDRLRERIVLRLRMLEGMPLAEFERQHHCTVAQVIGPIYGEFQRRGLWEVRDGYLRLTREGLLVSDSIWPYILVPRHLSHREVRDG